MPAVAKHRRTRRNPVSRGWALVGTGGVAIALPLIAPAGASAAPVSAAPEIAVRAVAAPAAPAALAAPAKAPAAPATARTYTVVGGDSLSLIAKKKGIQGGWKDLYRANRATVGDNPSLIHPGLELTIRRDSAKAAPAQAKKSSATTERASRSERRTAPVTAAVATGTG
ncbi:LysM domain-containing protein, partial [Streptomyces sp. SR27]|uniref:LysM peptidoglycan-binding domain-containing protein n=1 Tax=Streptomyces sp. SR27 TaxID=3076630 RepID=UPI00295B1CE0